jgi:Tfp pilus assembly protein PilF
MSNHSTIPKERATCSQATESLAVAAVPVVFLALILIAPFLDRPLLWGVNHLRYHETWVWALCVLILVFLSLPSVRARVLSVSFQGWTKSAWRSISIVLYGILFVGFSDATHLLGDGYLLARELEHGFRKIANEPLSFWLLHHSKPFAHALGVSSSMIYSVWSVVSGLVYVAMVPAFSRQIAESPSGRTTLSLFLLVPAYLQLFFGYHETYPILYPLLLGYVWLAVAAMRGRVQRWVVCGLLGGMVALHFTMATLIPSMLLLLVLSGRQQGRLVATVLTGGLAFMAVLTGLLWLVDFDLATHMRHTAKETLLPLLSDEDHSVPYGALSLDHLVEFANQILLVYTPTLVALPFVSRNFLRTRISVFLLAAALPGLASTFFGFTVIGAFRDWDALSFPAVFTTIWAALALSESVEWGRLRHLCCVAVTVCAVQSSLWISVNADTDRSTNRFEDGLRYSNLSPRATAFGWETIGAHYLDAGDLGRASLSYERAIESDPRHPRYPNLLGFILMQAGDYSGAADQFELAERLDPERYEAPMNLGLSMIKIGKASEAVDAILRARDLRPDLARIRFALGVAYYANGDYRKAIDAYQAVLRIEPNLVVAHLNLGQIYGQVDEPAAKQHHFERVLEMEPQHLQADEISSWLEWYRRQ